jgi:hypothetical protein
MIKFSSSEYDPYILAGRRLGKSIGPGLMEFLADGNQIPYYPGKGRAVTSYEFVTFPWGMDNTIILSLKTKSGITINIIK